MWRRILFSMIVLSCGVAPAADSNSHVARELSLTFGNPEVTGYLFRKGVNVGWRVSVEELRRKNVQSLWVMKRDAAGKVTRLSATTPDLSAAITSVFASDPEMSHAETASYFVVPVDSSGFEGKPSAEARYSVQDYPENPRAFAESDIDEWSVPKLPRADDPLELALSNYPVMRGTYAPNSPKCGFNTAVGSDKYCLRPADPMEIWLRADDNWARLPRVRTWISPGIVGNNADSGSVVPRQPWRMPNDAAGIAAVRVTSKTQLALARPRTLKSFTIFIVGRQAGGQVAPILSSPDFGRTALFWNESRELVFRYDGRGKDGTTELAIPYSGIDKMHILVVHHLVGRGQLLVIANGESIAPRNFMPGRSVQFDWVGAPPDTSAGSSLQGLRGAFSVNAPPPPEGSDIAEIIAYSSEDLDEEDLLTTLRYLRKKYSLP